MPNSKIKPLQLETIPQKPDWWLNELRGTQATADHYQTVFGGAAVDLFKRDGGEPLLMFRPGVLSQENIELAYPSFVHAATGFNRARAYPTDTMGYLPLGGFRRQRRTSWTRGHREKFYRCFPLIEEMDNWYRNLMPERHANQRALLDPRYIIGTSAFTSGTMNRWTPEASCQYLYHPDKNNLTGAYAAMTAITTGNYTGGLLVIPRYLVAVDLRTGDLLLVDNREMHGNTPIIGEGAWERVSLVLFAAGGLATAP